MRYSRFLALALTVSSLWAQAVPPVSAPGGVSTQGSDGTVSVTVRGGRLLVTPMSNDIFRVTTVPAKGDLPFMPSQAAVLVPQKPNVNVLSTPLYVNISTPTTTASVNRVTGRLTFLTAAGDTLLSEAAGVDNSDPKARSVSLLTPKGESFYGAGERGHALRLNGDTLTMYNRQNYGYTGSDPRISQMGISVPYIASSGGWGLLFDDHTKSRLILGSDQIRYEAPDAVAPLSYYFINGGGTLAGSTAGYTALTGRQDLPPFWTLGYITSKYGYHNQAETLGAIDSLKRRGYPVDGIVLDLYWYGTETDMGRLAWDEKQWPDHRAMLDSLRSQGVNLVAITQPYINKKGAIDNYNELVAKGLTVRDEAGENHDVTIWVGESGMFDVSNPATRQWYWERYDSLTREGIAGWWGDLGEPEVHPASIRHANGMTAEQYHNAYGNEWSRLIYEGLRKNYPDQRPVLLMRGGTAGLQRYSVMPWTTDVSRSWGGLEPQINLMLSSGLSGLGYMSSDIGGFAVDPENPYDPELYVRWLQMGTFTPTLRTHAQSKPEPYHYPAQEPIIKKFIKMRYEWLPYNYTLAFENATHGLPLARPIGFRSGEETPGADGRVDEYLWGDNVLVAPVMKQGATSRKVYFPKGSTWISLNNDRLAYKGGTTATVKAPLSELPLFVREGSFIPRYTLPIENTAEYDLRAVTVDYYPSPEATEYTLYDDDRHSPTSLQEGDYMLTRFRGQRQPDGSVEITVSSEQSPSTFDWMPNARQIDLQVKGLTRKPKEVMTETDGTSTLLTGWKYNAATRTLLLPLTFDGTPLSLSIR